MISDDGKGVDQRASTALAQPHPSLLPSFPVPFYSQLRPFFFLLLFLSCPHSCSMGILSEKSSCS